MLIAVLLLVSVGLLVADAELFVENAAAAAGRLGVTLLAVAVLLASAEPEELLTAALASAQGRPGLAVGDAIGANVTMLTAALGLAALVRPLPIGPVPGSMPWAPRWPACWPSSPCWRGQSDRRRTARPGVRRTRRLRLASRAAGRSVGRREARWSRRTPCSSCLS